MTAHKHGTSKRHVPPHRSGLRVVALFEGAKGVLVLLAGCGLLTLLHHDLHEAAANLVTHLHLNPASHYPRIFLDLSEQVDDQKLWAMAGAALAYALARLAEAAGLWLRKEWAEWFGVLTGGIYIPVELYEVSRGITWPRIVVATVNVGVVSYLLLVLIKNGGHAKRG
jgi:uncharacterized membrane protein (DUF2068 family)